jgi:hypothetical protein
VAERKQSRRAAFIGGEIGLAEGMLEATVREGKIVPQLGKCSGADEGWVCGGML